MGDGAKVVGKQRPVGFGACVQSVGVLRIKRSHHYYPLYAITKSTFAHSCDRKKPAEKLFRLIQLDEKCWTYCCKSHRDHNVVEVDGDGGGTVAAFVFVAFAQVDDEVFHDAVQGPVQAAVLAACDDQTLLDGSAAGHRLVHAGISGTHCLNHTVMSQHTVVALCMVSSKQNDRNKDSGDVSMDTLLIDVYKLNKTERT